MVFGSEQGSSALAISVASRPGRTVCSVVGEIDVDTAVTLFDVVSAEVGCDVVVDLSGVTFMDSSGLRTLMMCRADLADQGRHLHVENPTDRVRRVFEISGLTDLLEGRPARDQSATVKGVDGSLTI